MRSHTRVVPLIGHTYHIFFFTLFFFASCPLVKRGHAINCRNGNDSHSGYPTSSRSTEQIKRITQAPIIRGTSLQTSGMKSEEAQLLQSARKRVKNTIEKVTFPQKRKVPLWSKSSQIYAKQPYALCMHACSTTGISSQPVKGKERKSPLSHSVIGTKH
ncbi:unnamed protein product [Trypanosoma congolense IL3000]|uniref:WGS project CAEQ00000000 data, annotated contig 1733 n=1 Tax=Trypanosoma congolense (strain IL3000) TaxID=1068625 RepID=F9W8F8_TRYCI|nr:unnamed protein product [Trypanosoma congolense IL3000]